MRFCGGLRFAELREILLLPSLGSTWCLHSASPPPNSHFIDRRQGAETQRSPLFQQDRVQNSWITGPSSRTRATSSIIPHPERAPPADSPHGSQRRGRTNRRTVHMTDFESGLRQPSGTRQQLEVPGPRLRVWRSCQIMMFSHAKDHRRRLWARPRRQADDEGEDSNRRAGERIRLSYCAT